MYNGLLWRDIIRIFLDGLYKHAVTGKRLPVSAWGHRSASFWNRVVLPFHVCGKGGCHPGSRPADIYGLTTSWAPPFMIWIYNGQLVVMTLWNITLSHKNVKSLLKIWDFVPLKNLIYFKIILNLSWCKKWPLVWIFLQECNMEKTTPSYIKTSEFFHTMLQRSGLSKQKLMQLIAKIPYYNTNSSLHCYFVKTFHNWRESPTTLNHTKYGG